MYRNKRGGGRKKGEEKKGRSGREIEPIERRYRLGYPSFALPLSLFLSHFSPRRADTFLPGTLCIPLASFAVSFLQEASIFILHNAFVIAACTLYLFRFCNAMKMYEAIAIIRTGMQNFSRGPGRPG